MKNLLSKLLILLAFLLTSFSVFSQESKVDIKQDRKIDSLLKKKIQWDRARFENSYFTLQLYYGNLDVANEILEQSKEVFPHIPVELSFETPNYKVQAGVFKDKIEGLKTLDTLKGTFPSAFLLYRKELE